MCHLSLPDRSSGKERWLFPAFACRYSTTKLIDIVSSSPEYRGQAFYRTDDIRDGLNVDDSHVEGGKYVGGRL